MQSELVKLRVATYYYFTEKIDRIFYGFSA